MQNEYLGGDPAIIINVKVQSLAAHAEDISINSLLLRADFLAITETWMEGAAFVNIITFQSVLQFP